MTPLEEIHQQIKDCLLVKVNVAGPQPLKVNDDFSVNVRISNSQGQGFGSDHTRIISLVFTNIRVILFGTRFAELLHDSWTGWPVEIMGNASEIFDLKAVCATRPNDVIAKVGISANFSLLHNYWVYPNGVNVECKVDL